MAKKQRITSEIVTFKECLQYILTLKNCNQFDQHWIPYECECAPCAMNYTFVGKLESMNADVQVLLDQIGKNLSLSSTKENVAYTKSKSAYFADIPKYVIRGLCRVYKHDYEMFGNNFTIPS